MESVAWKETRLIGLALKEKTSNINGQSAIDCGNLWRRFEEEGFANRIPGKEGAEILAVYHDYDGDHTQRFAFFIGCKVKPDIDVPPGMESFVVPAGAYQKITARGKMPDCVINAWKEIWTSDIPRTYQTDFEVYDERSGDRNSAEMDIFLSIS